MPQASINSYLPIALLAPGPLYLSIDSLLLGLISGLVICLALLLNLLLVFPLRNMFPPTLRLLVLLLINSALIVILQHLVQAHAYTLEQQLGLYFPLLFINALVLSYAEGLFRMTRFASPVNDLLLVATVIFLSLVFFGASREMLETGSLLSDLSLLFDTDFGGIRLLISDDGIPLFSSAAGSLFLLGLLCALVSMVVTHNSKVPGKGVS